MLVEPCRSATGPLHPLPDLQQPTGPHGVRSRDPEAGHTECACGVRALSPPDRLPPHRTALQRRSDRLAHCTSDMRVSRWLVPGGSLTLMGGRAWCQASSKSFHDLAVKAEKSGRCGVGIHQSIGAGASGTRFLRNSSQGKHSMPLIIMRSLPPYSRQTLACG